MARVGTSRRAPGVLTLALLLGLGLPVCVGLPGGAQAQASSHVVVIRATERVADAEAQRLDAVLLAEVARTSGLGAPELASLELSEIELAAGCSDTAAACLRAVAGMVGAEALLVRRLTRTPAGLALVLTWFDPSSDDDPRSIEAQAPDAVRLGAEMPRHVRRLFGVPEPVVAAEGSPDGGSSRGGGASTEATGSASSGSGVSVVPLIIAGAGAATLAVGVVFGLLSASAEDRYATTAIHTAADADAALAALDEARSRALVANVLYATGGGLLVVGVAWLVIDLATGRTQIDDRQHFGRLRSPGSVSWAFAPLPGGALLSLHGSL